jgi:hypothetical protein
MSRYRASGGRAIDVFMKRLVKLPTIAERATSFSGTRPVSACRPFSQPRGARANRYESRTRRQAHILAV